MKSAVLIFLMMAKSSTDLCAYVQSLKLSLEVTQAVLAIGVLESGLNTEAPDGAAGEIGPFQIMPTTGNWLLGHCGVQGELRDWRVNAQLAVCYYQFLLDKAGGDHMAAAAAYNGGPSVIPAIKALRPINRGTANYVWRWSRLYERGGLCTDSSQ